MSFSTKDISTFGLERYDHDIAAVAELVPRVDSNSLQNIRYLNKGKFGHVCLVNLVGGPPSLLQQDSRNSSNRTDHDQHSTLFASKSINLNAADPQDAAKQLANEAKILSGLDHENIIKLRGVCSETFSKSFAKIPEGYFLLFDVLDETLQNRLKKWRTSKKKNKIPRLSEKLLFNGSNIQQKLFKGLLSSPSAVDDGDYQQRQRQRMYNRIQETVIGIARGLEYLHSRQIVLRDLKPANIGYRNHNNTDGSKAKSSVRLIDFGMAQRVEECKTGVICGSLRYMAPEAMKGQKYFLGADVFSFGVLLFEICSLRLPYDKSTNLKRLSTEEFRNEVIQGEIRPMNDLEMTLPCSRIRDLIQECLDFPSKRPTCANIASRLDDIFNPSQLHSKFLYSKLHRG